MEPVTTPATTKLTNSFTTSSRLRHVRHSYDHGDVGATRRLAGDAFVAARVETARIADEARLGVGRNALPGPVLVLRHDPALPRDLLGRVLRRDQAAGVVRGDLVELRLEAGPGRVGPGTLERLDEELGVDPSVERVEIQLGLRVDLLGPLVEGGHGRDDLGVLAHVQRGRGADERPVA